MGKRTPTTVVLSFLIAVILVVGLSYWAVQAWPKEPEGALKPSAKLVLTPEMTAQQVQQQSGVTNPVLKEALGLASQADKNKTLAELGLSPEEAKTKLAAAMALQQEHATKDFRKIGSKFVLWAAFLTLVFPVLQAPFDYTGLAASFPDLLGAGVWGTLRRGHQPDGHSERRNRALGT